MTHNKKCKDRQRRHPSCTSNYLSLVMMKFMCHSSSSATLYLLWIIALFHQYGKSTIWHNPFLQIWNLILLCLQTTPSYLPYSVLFFYVWCIWDKILMVNDIAMIIFIKHKYLIVWINEEYIFDTDILLDVLIWTVRAARNTYYQNTYSKSLCYFYCCCNKRLIKLIRLWHVR